MRALSTSIFSKVADGTDLHSTIGGRIFKGRAKPGAEYPYIVFMIISRRKERNYTDTFKDVLVQFSLFSSQSSTAEVEEMYEYLDALFDEQTLTVSGHITLWMRETNATGPMSEEHTTKAGTSEVWHYAVDYNILLEVEEATTATEDYILDTDSDVFVDADDEFGMRA